MNDSVLSEAVCYLPRSNAAYCQANPFLFIFFLGSLALRDCSG